MFTIIFFASMVCYSDSKYSNAIIMIVGVVFFWEDNSVKACSFLGWLYIHILLHE